MAFIGGEELATNLAVRAVFTTDKKIDDRVEKIKARVPDEQSSSADSDKLEIEINSD